jgi:hypothetical protein
VFWWFHTSSYLQICEKWRRRHLVHKFHRLYTLRTKTIQFLAERELKKANFAHLKESLSRNRLEQRRTLCDISNDHTVNGKPNSKCHFFTLRHGAGQWPASCVQKSEMNFRLLHWMEATGHPNRATTRSNGSKLILKSLNYTHLLLGVGYKYMSASTSGDTRWSRWRTALSRFLAQQT